MSAIVKDNRTNHEKNICFKEKVALKGRVKKISGKLHLGGGTFFSFDTVQKGGLNVKVLWGSHLTSVRGPISYRFMILRNFQGF